MFLPPCVVRPLQSQHMRLSLLLLAIAFLFPSEMARAQVNYTGSGAVNFGSQAIGTASAAKTLSFSVSSGTTVGSIGVLTMGAPNLDFASASETTCTAMTYATATTCKVNVTLKPAAAGMRMGAVVFFSGANNTGTQLAIVHIYGIGTGPQIGFGAATAKAIDPTVNGRGLNTPLGVAVDGFDNLFVADANAARVVEVPGGREPATVLNMVVNGTSMEYPWGAAMDGAGDLFIADLFTDQVVELPAGGGAAIAIPTGDYSTRPQGVAVDGSGDLFIAECDGDQVVEMPADGGATIVMNPTLDGLGLNCPNNLALDISANLFITDSNNNRVVEIPAAGGAAIAIDPVVDGIGLSYPSGLAFDGTGDLFIADNNNRLVEVPAGGGAATATDPTANGKGLYAPRGLAFDLAGNLFIGDALNHRAVEIQRSQPPTLSFVTTPAGSTSADSPQTVTIQNVGNAPLIFPIPATGSNPSISGDFTLSSGGESACPLVTSSSSTPGTLAAGASCLLSISFKPATDGNLSGSLILIENALNLAAPGYATQTIQLSGIGAQAATLTSPVPGSTLAGSSVTFTWTTGGGVTAYWFNLGTGTSATASKDLYNSGSTTATSVAVTGLPTSGATINATLYSQIGGVWQPASYTYTEAPGAPEPAVLTTPGPGSKLAGSSATFTWTPGGAVTYYWLDLGTADAGADIKNIYNSGAVTVLSKTVTGIPQYGQTLYATLFSYIAGAWQPNVYTYTASGSPVAAVLSTPTPNSKLTTSSATFTWSPGGGVTKYWFNLGTEHAGFEAKNIYSGSPTAATSVTVSNLPGRTLGETIYATLYSYIAGAWQPTVYTYTSYGPQSPATLITPTPGSTLAGSSVTFSWTPGANVGYYWFNLGTAASGADAKNIDSVGVNGANSVTLTGLPTNGETIYATLYSYIAGAWQPTVYTYTAQ